MKHIINIIFIMLLFTNIASAQHWNLAGNAAGGSDILGTTNAIDLLIYTNNAERARIIGVAGSTRGFMGLATNSPTSVLSIDGSGTPTTTGEVFRTNGPATTTTYWRMLTNGTEFGSLFHIGTSSNFTVQATDNHLNFNSGYNGASLEAMRIVGGNGSSKRFIGIGDYSGSFSTAQSQLHQWITGNVNVYHQFSNGNTTASDDTKGFKVGITYNGGSTVSDAELISQQNGANMNFYTNNSSTNKRMTILSGGNVGINVAAPTSLLHTEATGLKNLDYTGHYFSNTATSTTANKIKYGVQVTSTQGWTGTSAYVYGLDVYATGASGGTNVGLNVNVDAGGTAGYSGLFSGGNVGINTTTPDYRLEVVNNTLAIGASATGANSVNTAGTFTANTATSNFGVRCTTSTGGSPSTNTGGSFYSSGGSSSNFGVHGEAYNGGGSTFNYGGWFKAESGHINRAVYGGSLVSANANYGGYFEALNGTNTNYGIYASGGQDDCDDGAAINCPDAAGFFSGDVYTTTEYFASDAFLKDNVSSLTNASSIINQLSPKTYTFKTQEYPSMHLSKKKQFGLIADDVEKILPQLVRPFNEPEVTDEEGNIIYDQVKFKALNYTQLIPILIAGFKEQQAQIEVLQTRLDGYSASPNAPSNSGTIELEDMATLQLLQNDPNPFSENTMIRWNIPGEFQNAVIYFYDNNGNQINTYKVNTKGAGELQIFGSRLSSGVYTYTLVVDGKMIDSKKMLKSK